MNLSYLCNRLMQNRSLTVESNEITRNLSAGFPLRCPTLAPLEFLRQLAKKNIRAQIISHELIKMLLQLSLKMMIRLLLPRISKEDIQTAASSALVLLAKSSQQFPVAPKFSCGYLRQYFRAIPQKFPHT